MLGTIIKMSFNREVVERPPGSQNVEEISIDVVKGNTVDKIFYIPKDNPDLNASNPFEYQTVSQNGILGAASAQSFIDRFILTEPNYQDNFTITRDENDVTITIINGEWNFNKSQSITAWVSIIDGATGPVNVDDSELEIFPEIANQEITDQCTYCYLYEPLRVSIKTENVNVNKIFIALKAVDTTTGLTVFDDDEFGNYDYINGQTLSVDLMKLARQFHDANVFKVSNLTDIVDTEIGWHNVVSKYKYFYTIKTNIETIAGYEIFKLPIIGGRKFVDFKPIVNQQSPITEAQQFGLSQFGIWQGYPLIITNLAEPNIDDSRPIITSQNQPIGTPPCGGYLIWKSRLGGWMQWGFDIKTEKNNHKYMGMLESELFQSTEDSLGSPFVPVNYTGIETDYSITLKALGLTQEELLVANSIGSSSAVYLYRLRETEDQPSQMELMRLTSFSAPITSLGSGGDFSVSLKSISQSSQNTL